MNEYADDEEIIEAPILETDEEADDVPLIQPDADAQGPTYERADAEPFQPVPKARDNWNQFEDRKTLLDRAARAAAEGDAAKAARIRAVHDNYSFSRMEIEENIERLEARMKRERARKALNGAPVTAAFLDETPADAPIFQNDLDLLAKTEKAFSDPLIAVNPLSGKPYDRWGSKRAEPAYYADDETEGLPEDLRQKIAYQRTGLEMLANDVERGFGSGVATTREGAIWGRVMRGEANLTDPEVQAQLEAVKDDLRYYESDEEQGAFYHAGNLVGSMVGAAPEATPLATGTALVGLGLGLAGAPVSGLALLGATLTAGLWDATNRVESGLSYKTLIEAGAEPAKARQIANAVGVVNATIETGLTACMGAATAKIMKPFLSPVVDKVAARFARGMTEPSVSRAFGKGVMLWGVGAASESATEVLQEVSAMVGEEVGRLYADANIDPLTREAAVDRLVETAWATFRGALVLAGPGVAGGFGGVLAAKARADARVMRVQQMVEAVQQMESVQTSPAAVEQVLAKQAEGTPQSTIYVDGVRFAESLQQAGVTREDLKAVAPEVEAQLDAAVEAGTDVEIPSATYVTRIAPTKLGEATMPHIRMNPEELSQAEAAEAVKDFNTLTREIAQGGDVERIVETSDQRVAKIANEEERAALKAFEDKLVEDLSAATEENRVIPENTIRGQAKLATMAALVQAKRVKMPVGQFLERFGPRVVAGRLDATRAEFSVAEEASGYDETATPPAPRGSFVPASSTIILTPNADLSTFSHEMGHWYLSTLFEMSKLENASATVLEDVQTMLKQFGVESVDAWDALGIEGQRKHHEAFAHWTEVYFATGKAPNSATQRFFSRLGAWIRDVYRLLRGNAVDAIGENYRREFGEALPELSDEVRRVLDRMIVSEDMLDDALAAEGLKPLFDQKPDDMSDADWAELQLARDDAEQEGIEILHKLRAKDEAWAAKAQSAELKKIQAQAKEVRDKIRAQIAAEVNSEPAFAAADIIRRGNKAAVTFNLKMDPDAVATFGLNANQMAQLRAKGFLKKGGLDPQATFNELRLISVKFPNARKMLEALVRVGDPDEIIERRTTERCIAEHSELFDPKKVQAAVHKAVHQEARARMVATELKYIAGDGRARSRIYLEAARMAAREQLGRIAVGKLKVRSLVAAERRASTEAYRAIKAGDRAKAVSAKRRQLVLHEMIRTAIKFEDDFRKFQKLHKDAFGSSKKIAKTRDMDIVSVVRYVLTNEGYGKPNNDATAAPKFVEKLQKYNDDRAAVFAAILERHPYRPGLEWKNRSVADAIRVVEEVTGLWRMAAMERSVYLNGRREDRKAIAEALCSTRLQSGDYKAGFNRKTTPAEAVTHKLLTVSNMLKAVESWCVRMDGHDPDGPWQKYIYRPIANGAAKYRVESGKFQKRLAELAEARAENWAKVRDIHFAYGNYTFLTKAELIGALLHTGNMSNKTKLLVGGRSEGRTWARVHYVNGQEFVDMSGWDSFVEECFENGTLTKEDMDFVQAVWDLLEETKAPAQKAFRQIFGFYFEEVEASPIETPWGTYRGGYVPAITDHDLVHDQKLKEEREIQGEQDFLSAMPVKTPGFSVSRVEQYRKPLNLDFGRLGAHIDKVLRFAYIAPQATEVAKLLNDFDVQDHLAAFDPTARTDLLQVWLKRSTEQSLTTDRSSWVGQKVNKLRSLAGANIMAGNIVNAMQQVTGLSVAVPYVGAKALWQAHKTFFLNPKDTVRRISEASNFMKNRFHDRAMEYQSRLRRASAGTIHMDQAKTMFDKMATVDAKLEPVRDFFMRNAYILQSVVQVPIDGIVWLAAYNKYLSDHGRTGDGWIEYEPARDYADSIVRRTQSDFSPENIANVEAGNSATRLFLVFYRYFGTMLNLLSDSWDRAKLTGDYGRFVADAFFIVWIPSVVSSAIGRLIGQGFDQDDDGFDGMDAFQLFVGEPLKGVIAMAPFVGGAINAGGAALAKAGSKPAQAIFGTDPYVGRIYSSPAFDLLETSGGGLLDLYRLTQGQEVNARKITREMLDLTSVVTGLPFGALKRPLGYVAGVKDGQYEEPANPFEAVSGLVSGKGKEE